MEYFIHQENYTEESRPDYSERGKTAGRPEPKRR